MTAKIAKIANGILIARKKTATITIGTTAKYAVFLNCSFMRVLFRILLIAHPSIKPTKPQNKLPTTTAMRKVPKAVSRKAKVSNVYVRAINITKSGASATMKNNWSSDSSPCLKNTNKNIAVQKCTAAKIREY